MGEMASALAHDLNQPARDRLKLSQTVTVSARNDGLSHRSLAPTSAIDRGEAEIGKDYVALPIHEIERHLGSDLEDAVFLWLRLNASKGVDGLQVKNAALTCLNVEGWIAD